MRMQNFAIQFPPKDNKGAQGKEARGGREANKSVLSSLQSSNQVRALLAGNQE